MATKKKPIAKTTAKKPKVSSITIAAQTAVAENQGDPKGQGLAAALAVIKALKRRAQGKPGIVKFLDAMQAEVKVGGGQDGGAGAEKKGPPDPP